jgi:hypothetical protein
LTLPKLDYNHYLFTKNVCYVFSAAANEAIQCARPSRIRQTNSSLLKGRPNDWHRKLLERLKRQSVPFAERSYPWTLKGQELDFDTSTPAGKTLRVTRLKI